MFDYIYSEIFFSFLINNSSIPQEVNENKQTTFDSLLFQFVQIVNCQNFNTDLTL